MNRKAATATPTLAPPKVDGLEHGRQLARRRASRRRFKDRVIGAVLFLVVGAGVAAGAYYLLDFYGEEQDRNSNVGGPGLDGRTNDELIDDLETQPRWNGPGNPTFGVGDAPPAP